MSVVVMALFYAVEGVQGAPRETGDEGGVDPGRGQAAVGEDTRGPGHLPVLDIQLVQRLDVLAHEADRKEDHIPTCQLAQDASQGGLQPAHGPHLALIAQPVASGDRPQALFHGLEGGVDLLLVGVAGLDLLERKAVSAEDHGGAGKLGQGGAEAVLQGLPVRASMPGLARSL